MKKYLLIILLAIAIYSLKISPAFANTLYTNSLTSASGNLSNWYDTNCHLTVEGAACDGNIAIYNTHIAGTLCISGDYVVSPSSNKDDFLMFSDDPTDANALQALAFRPGTNLRILTTTGFAYDTGITTQTGQNTYTICKTSHTYSVYLNSNLLTSQMAGNYEGTYIGFQLSSTDTLSNLVVTDSLPTPTPQQTHIPVTPLKQTDPSWKNETYDLANLWSPTDDTIGTWGCALTSATMVLNYYHITNLPGFGNTPLNPYTLGEWLDTQPDGYIPNGNVNWLAIARLSKLAKTNNSTLLDALEYKRSNFADTTTLLADLNTNHPDILEEPGHFVVATGQSGSTYTINDPYYNRTDLTSYGNTFLSLGRFVPSFTDLSYILFTADPSLTITLKDSNNNPIGTSYVQQPLTGAETGLTAGNPIQLLYLEQPGNGTYTLTVSGSSNQLYTLKGYLYDKDGNVKPFTQTGVTGPNNQNTITVNFDNQDLTNDSTQKDITINTLLNDLTSLYNTNQIKKAGYKPLTSLAKNVQKDTQKHNKIALKVHLSVLKTILGVDKKIGLLTDSAYQILLADVQYLQSH